MKNLKILFNFATRSRPKKFINVINELCDKLYDYENCIILVSIDNDDDTMNSDEIKNFILNHRYSSIIKVFSSDSKGKIIATNYNINKISDWDIVMNIADDFEFPKENIDLHIRKYMLEFYPDLDGILHFPDGIQNELICTHPVMGRKYYERFGYIFNPIYYSFYCDDELTQVGKILNKITYIGDFIYLHKHYYFNPGSMDELDIENEKYASTDRETYDKRKNEKFSLI